MADTQAASKKIEISDKKVSIGLGAQGVEQVLISNKKESAVYTYKSSDTSIVKVDSQDILTGVKYGTAKITVSFEGNHKYAAAKNKNIIVTVSLNDAGISVNNNALDLKVSDTFTIVPTTTPKGLGVIYLPDNSTVISVDENGVVKALKEGNATITVGFAGDKKYAAAENKTISVTVKLKDASVSVENATLDLLVDENATIVAVTTPVFIVVVVLFVFVLLLLVSNVLRVTYSDDIYPYPLNGADLISPFSSVTSTQLIVFCASYC